MHWAEEPLLELIEHLAERVKDAPLMILCLARPELLDVRPSWGGGNLRAAATELEPLALDESEELLEEARRLQLKVIVACSIVAIGENPYAG